MFRTISARLAGPFVLFLLPVAFLLQSLVGLHHSATATVRNELTGIGPAVAILELMTQIARYAPAPQLTEHAVRVSAELAAFPARSGGDPDAARRLAAAATLATAMGRGERAPGGRDAMDIMAEALRAVGNSSELILDPELATYHLADILISRDSGVIQTLASIRERHAQLYLAGLGPSEIVVALKGYVESLAQRAQGLAAAFRIAEGALADSAAALRLELTVGRYLEALGALELEMQGRLRNGDFGDLHQRVLDSSVLARGEVAGLLRGLLEARVIRQNADLRRHMLTAALMFVGAAAAMMLLIGRLVTQPLRTLTGSMLALAEGDTGASAPGTGRADEIGAMARAFTVFRDNALRRATLEEKARLDAAALRQLARRLEASGAALAEAQRIGRMGSWSWRFNDDAFDWSDEIYRLMQRSKDEFTPTRAAVLAMMAPASQRQFLEAEAAVMRGGETRTVDVEVPRGDGECDDFTIALKADRDASGQLRGLVGTIHDITQRKKAERDLEQLAYYDPLSGLGNRTLFQRRMLEALDRGRATGGGFALMMLDLDRFKEVNDSLGHQAGDELLFLISDRLQRVAPRDAVLARLGGDEFAALMPAVDQAGVRVVASAMIEALSAPVALSQGEVSIGTSVGIAMFPRDGDGDDQLMQAADLALYRAKDSGRGMAVFFDPSFSEIAQDKIRLGRDLAQALRAEDQLFLVYQAQVDAISGRVTGFEALLRWRHPERGLVPPGEFVPIAESSKLICDLGEWVLREACRQMMRWRDDGQMVRPVSVNISPAHFWLSDVEAFVRKLLQESGLSPGWLCLEVTETVFMREGDGRARRALDALKALGVQLALDDFGTGYSSLGILNRLPFDKIKIDRCFVSNADREPEKAKLLEGIVSLARSLEKRTVAEGAETTGELLLLSHIGCDEIQGFVFARPLEADEALAHADEIERHFGQQNAA